MNGYRTNGAMGENTETIDETDDTRLKIDCADCNFSRVVSRNEKSPAADPVVEHTEETGHKLQVKRVEE